MFYRSVAFFPALLLATSALTAQTPTPPPADPAAKPGYDLDVLHAQVILDRLGFSPGVIDAKAGQSFALALRGFQTARGIPTTGKLDPATLQALAVHKDIRPIRTDPLTAADLAGPFTGPTPKKPADQAKLAALGYQNIVERLAEKYHTTPAMLLALNPPGTPMKEGQPLRYPDVTPASFAYLPTLKPEWTATLAGLNVGADQPQGKRIVVDKSEGALKVYDAEDKLVAQFPATMGSKYDPLPIGSWTIQGASYNPPFHYNPKLFWDAQAGDKQQKLPPGPNGPVGVVWLDLSKPHYGIHGTPHPEKIGRTESHGCIRLTNWDAARLSMMVKPGTPAQFQP